MSPVRTEPGLPPVTDDFYPIVQPHTDIGPLFLWVDGKVQMAIRNALVSDRVKLTMDGAHTIELVVADPKRKLLRSGCLGTRTDIQVVMQRHVYWFRLADVKKNKDLLTLVFEDRHVQIMRQFNKKLLVARDAMNRCQFVYNLVIEAKAKDPTLDFNGPCVGMGTPPPFDPKESTVPYQPPKIYKPNAKPDYRIKGHPADADQIRNINTILGIGKSLKARRKVLVVSMMVAIQESSIRNLSCVKKYGKCPNGPIGVFQQFHSDCWPASQKVDVDATAFFRGVEDCPGGGTILGCIKTDKKYPNCTYPQLGMRTQNPYWSANEPWLGDYEHDLSAWRVEAERIVTMWGQATGGKEVKPKDDEDKDKKAKDDPFAIPPGWEFASADGSDQQWHRGSPKKQGGRDTWSKENTWDCVNRMANEVQWYAFMNEDFLTFAPSDWFWENADHTVMEFDPGVDWIDGDYDRNKKSGTVTITTYLNKWNLLPGKAVLLKKMGPWNGIWCVSEVQGSLSSDKAATVTLKKLLPPVSEDKAAPSDDTGGTGGEIIDPETKQPKARGGPYNLGPVIKGHGRVCDQYITHVTENLEDHVAYDDFAPGGTIVIAPEGGTVDYWGHSTPGCSLALWGDSGIHWWFGHLNCDDRAPVNSKVQKGQKIGTVLHGFDHVHVGMDTRNAAGFQVKGCEGYKKGGCGYGTICEQLNGK